MDSELLDILIELRDDARRGVDQCKDDSRKIYFLMCASALGVAIRQNKQVIRMSRALKEIAALPCPSGLSCDDPNCVHCLAKRTLEKNDAD